MPPHDTPHLKIRSIVPPHDTPQTQIRLIVPPHDAPQTPNHPKIPTKKEHHPPRERSPHLKLKTKLPILLTFLLQHHLNRCPNSAQITKAQVVINHHRQLPNRIRQLKRTNNNSVSLELKRATLNSRLVRLNRQIISQFK